MILLVAGAVIIFAAVATEVMYRFRSMPIDGYDPGPWRVAEVGQHHLFTSEVRSMAQRLDNSMASTDAWDAVLERLDRLHIELSPFGENARRPPHVYRTWSGATKTRTKAPRYYDSAYLQNYIETLETLAGVDPDE